ncbi:MAG: DUF2232 domain-containing protein [Nitrospinales bacterium]
MPNQDLFKGILLPAAIVLAIFFIALLLSPLGMVVGILAPAPLVVVSLQKGKQAGLIAAGLVVLAIMAAMGPQVAVFFFAEYAAMAFIMAETLRRRLAFEKCVAFSALGSAALTGFLLLLVFTGQEMPSGDFLEEQIKAQFRQSVEALNAMGRGLAGFDSADAFIEKTSRLFAASYPAVVVIGSLFGALANYSVARALTRRQPELAPYFSGSFSTWMLPEHFIWIFILSAGALFLPEGTLQVAGLNVFIIAAVIYCLQGMAIVVHFLDKKNVPFFLWIVVFIVIFAQPFLVGILMGLGLFEMWVDFRKLRINPSEET